MRFINTQNKNHLFAYDNYPKGTKFKTHSKVTEIAESSGDFRIAENASQGFWVTDNVTNWVLFRIKKHGWPEIVKPKIAVKEVRDPAVRIKNKKEQVAIEKYLKAEHNDTVDFPAYVYPNDLVLKYFSWDTDCEPHREIIPFSEFSKEHNIKLPLITSEDGVDLYEGDYCYVAVFRCNKWFLDDHSDGGDSERFEVCNNGKFVNSKNEKHFKDATTN